jgi:hypothetical protein
MPKDPFLKIQAEIDAEWAKLKEQCSIYLIPETMQQQPQQPQQPPHPHLVHDPSAALATASNNWSRPSSRASSAASASASASMLAAETQPVYNNEALDHSLRQFMQSPACNPSSFDTLSFIAALRRSIPQPSSSTAPQASSSSSSSSGTPFTLDLSNMVAESLANLRRDQSLLAESRALRMARQVHMSEVERDAEEEARKEEQRRDKRNRRELDLSNFSFKSSFHL